MRSRQITSTLCVLALIGGLIAWVAIYRNSRGPAPTSSNAGATTAPSGPIAFSGPAMGSTWMVRLPRLPSGVSAQTIQRAVQQVLDGVDSQMSTYRPDSNLSRFNQSSSPDWIVVPQDTAQVVFQARQVSEQTGGAFDVTVGPLVNLWGFGPHGPDFVPGTIPSNSAIEQARRHVNYHLLDVRLFPPAIRKADPLVYVDLSAIAKGYSTGLVGKRLEELGVNEYLIGVGGEMRAKGLSPLNRPWRVGIETPTPGTRRVLFQVELRDLCLSTSGDYENFFDKEGRRYSHEIDPATGRPADPTPASVSVAHSDGAYADAMATALMVMGPDRSFEFAVRNHLAALIIVRTADHFDHRSTPEFERLLVSPDDAR